MWASVTSGGFPISATGMEEVSSDQRTCHGGAELSVSWRMGHLNGSKSSVAHKTYHWMGSG